MFGTACVGEDTRVYTGMECLDTPVQTLRESGEFLDPRDLHSGLGDPGGGGAGGDDLHARGIEGARQFLQTGLVVDADECAGDCLAVVAHGCFVGLSVVRGCVVVVQSRCRGWLPACLRGVRLRCGAAHVRGVDGVEQFYDESAFDGLDALVETVHVIVP